MIEPVRVISRGREYRVTFKDPDDIAPKVEVMATGKRPGWRNVSRQQARSKYLDISIKGRAILRGNAFKPERREP